MKFLREIQVHSARTQYTRTQYTRAQYTRAQYHARGCSGRDGHAHTDDLENLRKVRRIDLDKEAPLSAVDQN